MASISSAFGRPVTSMIRSNWFIVDVPGNMGLPPSNSPRMQPIDHISTPLVYLFKQQLAAVIAHTQRAQRYVLGGAEKNFRGAVPTSGDVISEHGVTNALSVVVNRAGKTKVSDLHETLRVQQQVGGLKIAPISKYSKRRAIAMTHLHITMQDLTSVHVLDGLEQLIDNVALVNVLQNIGSNNCVEIRFCHKTEIST